MKTIPDHVWNAAVRCTRLFHAITANERYDRDTVLEESQRQERPAAPNREK